jgi:hypothetical protein
LLSGFIIALEIEREVIFRMSKRQSNWEWRLVTTTVDSVNKDLKEVAEKKQFLKSMHVLGDKILLLVGQLKRN